LILFGLNKGSIPKFQGKPFDIDESNMRQDLDNLFNSPTFSDLKIICDEKEIYVHKMIIGIRFASFLELFNDKNIFNCKIPYEHAYEITRWIYTGKFKIPNNSNVETIQKSIVALSAYPLLNYLNNSSDSGHTPSFAMIFNESTLSDVTFLVGDAKKEIFGHRALITARCDYFKSMFLHGFKEGHQSKIELPHVQLEPFLELMKFLYTDNFDPNLVDNLLEVMEIAHQYNVPRLFKIGAQFLWENACVDNICDIYQVCLHYGKEVAPLMEKVEYIVGYYFAQVEKTPSFMQLGVKHQQELCNLIVPGTWEVPPNMEKKKKNCCIQ